MDVLKKFFENTYLYLTSTIAGFFAALWLTVRHPILGPQYLARAQAQDRAAIEPLLFMFVAALLYIANIFAFDLNRNELLNPLLAGKADPKLYMIALATLVFLLLYTTLCTIYRRLLGMVRTLQQGKARPRRLLRRRRMIAVMPDPPLVAARLAGRHYVIPVTIVYMLSLLVVIALIPGVNEFVLIDMPGYFWDLLPGTAFTIEVYLLSEAAVPVSIGFGQLVGYWLTAMALAPAFLPQARLLFFPRRLVTPLGLWRWPGLVAAAGLLCTSFFIASVIGIAAYFWLSGPKPAPDTVTAQSLMCDTRYLPDFRAAVQVSNPLDEPIILTEDAIKVRLVAISAVDQDDPEDGNWVRMVTEDIPMVITRIGQDDGRLFFSIPAGQSALITLAGTLDLAEPIDLASDETLRCAIGASSRLMSSDALFGAFFGFEGDVILPEN
ncbi:MAG: hypothetical protein AAFQ19_13155 [Pseudomonadota bacterium]